MIKGFRQIASLTALSRVFGLIRTILYFYFFGASGLLDAWFIAFKIPNLSRRLFGEGAASASFIPIYSHKLHEDSQKASRLADTVITVIFVLLAALVLLVWMGIWAYYKLFAINSETRLILFLTSIMLPYMPLVCVVAILAGILNVHKHFASPAAAPIVLNILIISTIMITGWLFNMELKEQLFAVAAAVLVAGLLQVAIQIPPLRAAGVSIKPAWQIHSKAFKKIIIMMGPMILGLTVTQINTLLDDLIAWWFSSSPEKGNVFLFLGNQIAYPLRRGCVSHLNGAQRLYQLPLGVFGISLATAIFPVMSSDAARNDFAALSKTVSRGLRGAVFLALPATVGLLLVAKPLVSVIFGHGKFTEDDTTATAWVLLFYAIGLTGYFAQHVITRAFYSMQDSLAPARSALIAVLVNIVLNLTLIWFLSTGGLAAATAACSYLQVVILIAALRRSLRKQGFSDFGRILDDFVPALLKTIAATLCMFAMAVIALGLSKNWANIFKLLLVIPSSAIVYLLASKFLRIEMLSLLTRPKQEKNTA